MRCLPAASYAGQLGARASLNAFGSPARTNESQYAISSSANARSTSRCGWNVVVPFHLSLARAPSAQAERVKKEREREHAPGRRAAEHHPVLGRVARRRAAARGRHGLVVPVRPRLAVLLPRRGEADDGPRADELGLAGRDLEALRLRGEVAQGVDREVLLQARLRELRVEGLEVRGDVRAERARLV